MISPSSFSTESVDLLKVRGLSEQQISDFSALLSEARAERKGNVSAKQVLSNMSSDELKLLQRATSLADPIKIDALSKEGAMNLLAQPDKTGLVDLNNDGLVEVGAARMMVFPPVNAPDHVKAAWDEATAHMATGDKMILELQMHLSIYGPQIEGQPTKQPLTPTEQWSEENIVKWLAEGRAGLEFNVKHFGWTHHNLVKQDFYNRFEQALAS